MKTALLSLGLVVAMSATAAAQQPSFTPFGTGCTTQGSRDPVIGNRNLPRIGQSFTITYAGPNAIVPGIQLTDQPTIVLGFQRIDWPVPPLLPLQPTGCTLYPTPDVVLPMPPDPTQTAFVDELTIAIPNDPALVGATFFAQWMTPHSQCFFVGCGLGWVVFSNAATIVVGV